MSKDTLYVSVDMEADGPAPGPYSMLSVASAAFTIDKELVDIYSVNLECLPGAEAHPVTMKWWTQFPEAWAETRRDPVPPETAIPAFAEHIRGLKRMYQRLVFVAYPVAFDFGWVNWYMWRYAGDNPFGAAGLCLKSLGSAMLGVPYEHAHKEQFPARWFDGLPHTHIALADAVEQGAMGINMLRESLGLAPKPGIVNYTRLDLSRPILAA